MKVKMKMVYLWIVATTVTITNVASQPFLKVKANRRWFLFTKSDFERFRDCICSQTTRTCTVSRRTSGYYRNWVYDVSTTYIRNYDTTTYSKRYTCERKTNEPLRCSQLVVSDDVCSDDDNCWSYSFSGNCELEPVGIVWKNVDNVWFSNDAMVDISACAISCETSTTSTTSTITTTKTVTTSSWTPSTTAFTSKLSTTSFDKSTIVSANQTDLVADQDEGDKSAVIIGVVIGLVLLAAILVIVGIIVWKRRRNADHGKSSTTDQSRPTVTDPAYSMAFTNTEDTKPGQKVPMSSAGTSSYAYATIDPTREVISNGIASTSNTEDPEYYNQGAVGEDPPPDKFIDPSLMAGQQDPSYYNLDNSQTGSVSSTNEDMKSFSNTAIDTQDSVNVYATTDENNYTINDTYSDIDDTTSKETVKNGQNQNNNRPAAGITQYEYANPAMTIVGTEYSKLHDPVRHFKDPYNVLSPSEDGAGQDGSAKPTTSADRAVFTYSLAQPFLKKSTNHTQPPEVIDVDPPSQQPIKDEEPQVSSELTNRKATEFSDGKRLHLKEDLSGPLYKETNGSGVAASNGRRNEYFELEKNYDSDASDTV